MKIYTVQYSYGYDAPDVIVGYYFSEEEANQRAKQINKENPGIGCFVDYIEVQ